MRTRLFVKGLHNVLLFLGVVGILLCVHGLYCEMFLDYNMRIMGIQIVCEQPLNNRCRSLYSIQRTDGTQETITTLYGSMFRDSEIVPGNTIKKAKFSFEYEVNGEKVGWAYAGHYLLVLLLSLIAIGLWRWFTPKRPNDQKVVVEVNAAGFQLAGKSIESRAALAQALMKSGAKIVDLRIDHPVSDAQIEQARLAIRDANASIALSGAADAAHG